MDDLRRTVSAAGRTTTSLPPALCAVLVRTAPPSRSLRSRATSPTESGRGRTWRRVRRPASAASSTTIRVVPKPFRIASDVMTSRLLRCPHADRGGATAGDRERRFRSEGGTAEVWFRCRREPTGRRRDRDTVSAGAADRAGRLRLRRGLRDRRRHRNRVGRRWRDRAVGDGSVFTGMVRRVGGGGSRVVLPDSSSAIALVRDRPARADRPAG